MQDLMQAFEAGKVKEAMDLNAQMLPVAKAMFITTNPIPVKEAVSILTPINAGPVRLPLVPMSSIEKEKVCDVLKKHGLI